MPSQSLIARRLAAAILLQFATAESARAWLPGTGSPLAADGFSVDTSDRADVFSFYNCVYRASENYSAIIGWTGSIPGGSAGTTTELFKEDVRRRINFYRALTGQTADIVFEAGKSSKSQKSALMMSANTSLSHFPAANWTWYTPEGAEAAAASNLAIGLYGPAAVDGYMSEEGSANRLVGHRRWLLYPRAREMGTGDIPPSGSYRSSNTLWVVGDFKAAPPPAFVAWPNEGFVPAPLVSARWSLTYPGADFGSATVTMSLDGGNVPVSVVSRTDNGFGDNTIVWEPSGMPATVTADQSYLVTVSGIGGSGVPMSETYTVTLFNPDVLNDSVTISGSDEPSAAGQTYTFNPIGQADSYELAVATLSPESWTEGAEDAPLPRISEAISPGYSLRQTELIRSGTKAFQLTFPPDVWSDQSFVITRGIVPAASSRLEYYDLARWTYHPNSLETQISTNGGSVWTTLTSRNGVSINGLTSEWDSSWNARSVSLAAYAGQVIQLRFILKNNGSGVFQGVSSSYGFFIDDITVTDASQLAATTTTSLPGGASSFTLDALTAGAPLIPGTAYTLRIRPSVGCRWFGFGAMKSVTATEAPPPPPAPSFLIWAAELEALHALPEGTLADPNGDADHDGRPNLLEYAFGGSPVIANDPAARLPQAHATATHFLLRYQLDTSLGDLIITPQACSHLGNWRPPGDSGAPAGFTDEWISTDGTLQTREARIPLSTGTCFLRIKVSRP